MAAAAVAPEIFPLWPLLWGGGFTDVAFATGQDLSRFDSEIWHTWKHSSHRGRPQSRSRTTSGRAGESLEESVSTRGETW